MTKLKYFYEDHKEQIHLVGKYGIAMTITWFAPLLAVILYAGMMVHDVWVAR